MPVVNLVDAFKKAIGSWDPAKHPRDRDGQFIETGDFVKVYSGPGQPEPEYAGRVIAANLAPDGRLFIGVEAYGYVRWARPKQIEHYKVKALLNKTPELPIPMVDAQHDEVFYDDPASIMKAPPGFYDADLADEDIDSTVKKSDIDSEFLEAIGLEQAAKPSVVPQPEEIYIPASKTPDDILQMIGTSFENKYQKDNTIIYPGGVAGFKNDLDNMLNDPDFESAKKKLSKLMTTAKLGGKQRKRYNAVLLVKHGGSKQALEVTTDEPAPGPKKPDYDAGEYDQSDVDYYKSLDPKLLQEIAADNGHMTPGELAAFNKAVAEIEQNVAELIGIAGGEDGFVPSFPKSTQELVLSYKDQINTWGSDGIEHAISAANNEDAPELSDSAKQALLEVWGESGGGVVTDEHIDMVPALLPDAADSITDPGANADPAVVQNIVHELVHGSTPELSKKIAIDTVAQGAAGPVQVDSIKQAMFQVYDEGLSPIVTAADLEAVGVYVDPEPISPEAAAKAEATKVLPEKAVVDKIKEQLATADSATYEAYVGMSMNTEVYSPQQNINATQALKEFAEENVQLSSPEPTLSPLHKKLLAEVGTWDHVYSHPQGSVIVVKDDKATKYNTAGVKSSTSATPEKLAYGHGLWAYQGYGMDAVNAIIEAKTPAAPQGVPTPAPVAAPSVPPQQSEVDAILQDVADDMDPAGAIADIKKQISANYAADAFSEQGWANLKEAVKQWEQSHAPQKQVAGVAPQSDKVAKIVASIQSDSNPDKLAESMKSHALVIESPQAKANILAAVEVWEASQAAANKPVIDTSQDEVLLLLATTFKNKNVGDVYPGGYEEFSSDMKSLIETEDFDVAASLLNKIMKPMGLGGKQRKRYKDALAAKFGEGPSAVTKTATKGSGSFAPIEPAPGGVNTPAGVVGPTKGNALVNAPNLSASAAKASIQTQIANRMKGKVTGPEMASALTDTAYKHADSIKTLGAAAKQFYSTGKVGPNDRLVKDSTGYWRISSPAAGYNQGKPVTKETLETALLETVANSLIQQWAGTSNDSNARSLAMQELASEEFGLQNTYDWPVDANMRKTIDMEKDRHRKLYRLFLREQYNNTQEWAKANGIKKVRLRRGSNTYAGTVGSTANIKLRPMSSFSTNKGTSDSFGSHRIEAIVPIEWVIGTAATGYGCKNEYEWVVLGGVHKVKVTN